MKPKLVIRTTGSSREITLIFVLLQTNGQILMNVTGLSFIMNTRQTNLIYQMGVDVNYTIPIGIYWEGGTPGLCGPSLLVPLWNVPIDISIRSALHQGKLPSTATMGAYLKIVHKINTTSPPPNAPLGWFDKMVMEFGKYQIGLCIRQGIIENRKYLFFHCKIYIHIYKYILLKIL